VVSAQVGLTVVLLVAGGLFGRSLSRLMAVDPGFVAEGLVTLAFRVPPAHAGSDEAAARFQERVVQAARSLPGVTASSATTELPFPGGRFARSFTLGPDGPRAPSVMRHRSVLPDYHETMGIPLLQGRHLAETDGPGAPRVAVVSRSFAERTWPGEPALEKRIYNTGPAGEWTIVGVVGDVRQQTLAAPPEPTLYRTTAQVPSRTLHLVARTGADPRAALRDLRRTISGLDPDTPITEAGGVPELIQAAEGDDRFRSRLVLTFAVVATLLAGVGIFTITAFTAAARTREIGIRAALGASDRALAWLVFREGLISAVIGVALGFVAAVWLAGVIRHLLYEIDSRDPITYLVAGAHTFAACGVAGWWPALRVGRMAPAEAIRHEEWA
jgi:predicted permease